MSEPKFGLCVNCKHWRPPSERNDMVNAVSFMNDESVYHSESGNVEYLYGDKEDQKFGLCIGIRLGEYLPIDKPTPLAVTRDASAYQSDLYTQAAFGCAMFEEKE